MVLPTQAWQHRRKQASQIQLSPHSSRVTPWLQAPLCSVNPASSLGWERRVGGKQDASVPRGWGWRQKSMCCLCPIGWRDRNENCIPQTPRWMPEQGCKQPAKWKALTVEVRSWLEGGNVCLACCVNTFEQLSALQLGWKLPSDNSFHFVFLYKKSGTYTISAKRLRSPQQLFWKQAHARVIKKKADKTPQTPKLKGKQIFTSAFQRPLKVGIY